jgi:hypothetical protein
MQCERDDELSYWPYLTSEYKIKGHAGDTLVVPGYNLTYDSTAERYITIGNQKIPVLFFNKDILIFIVPSGLERGRIYFNVGNYTATWGPDFIPLKDAEVSTIAGTGAVGNQDGEGTNATFNYPAGIAVDGKGMLYVADCYNRLIRKISIADHTVSSISIPETFLDGNTFDNPMHLSVNNWNGLIYVSGMKRNLLFIQLPRGFYVIYYADQTITGVTAVPDNEVYISVGKEKTIWKMDSGGRNRSRYRKDLSDPGALFYDWTNNRLIYSNVDSSHQLVIDDHTRFNTAARSGFVKDRYDNYYVADSSCNCIQKYDVETNAVITIAGNGTAADVDGMGLNASFDHPRGITIDNEGNLYVTTYNHERGTGNKIRKITFR